MIVPQTFKKVLQTKEGTIKTERFTVSGRKIPLLEIRTRMLKEHESLDGPDEPSTRPQGPKFHHFRSSDLKL